MTDQHYRVAGSLGSPYSMKMRAVFRYRRLPHIFQLRDDAVTSETAGVRPQIVPMVRFPDTGAWHVDSTPMALTLEERHPGTRSILPDDEVHRFVACLLEDFADEWLTKCMFHYRWYYAPDREYASAWVAADRLDGVTHDRSARAAWARDFNDRQVSRMALVGCTEANRPVIESTYLRVLDALEPHVAFRCYLFGSRPSLADFGLYGQLKTLSDDPTGQSVMRDRAPTVTHWLRQVDDLSGLDGEWGEPLPSVRALMDIVTDRYLPFLVANERAVERREDEVRLEFDQGRYAQAPFRYQVKCLGRLRKLFAALSPDARARLDDMGSAAQVARWLGPR